MGKKITENFSNNFTLLHAILEAKVLDEGHVGMDIM